MKTLTIYKFNELSDNSKEMAIIRSGNVDIIKEADTKETFIKVNLGKEAKKLIPKITNDLLSTVEYDSSAFRLIKGTKTPEFIPKFLFIDGKVFVKFHCKSYFCISSENIQFVKRTGISQAKGGAFKFDENQDCFQVLVNGKTFNLMDDIECCLLSESILNEIKMVKTYILEMESGVERHLNELLPKLDYDEYLKKFNDSREADILKYFEHRWFFSDGGLVPDRLLLEIMELDNG